MKYRTSTVLCLLAIFLLTLLPAAADETDSNTFTSGDYEYTVLEDGTAEITKYKGKAETLSIPTEIGGRPVTVIGDFAFNCCLSLSEVTIPEGVTSIGYLAFCLNVNLSHIIAPPINS